MGIRLPQEAVRLHLGRSVFFGFKVQCRNDSPFCSLCRCSGLLVYVKYLLNFDKHPKLLKWYHDQNFAFPFLFIFGKQKCWVLTVPSFIWKFEREVRLFLLEKFEKETKNFRHSTTLSLRIKYIWLKLIWVLLARGFSKVMYAGPKCVLSCYWSHLLVAPGYLFPQ